MTPTDDEDRPLAHQRRRGWGAGGWRGYRPTMPEWFDTGAYDDILDQIRREGRYDALGCDLVPAMYDNGDYPISPLSEAQRAALAARGYRRPRNAVLAARLVAEYEAEQRAKQAERERIAAIYWEAEASRRECVMAWMVAETAWRRREETMTGLRRLAETRRGPPKGPPPDPVVNAATPADHCVVCGDGRFCDGRNPKCRRKSITGAFFIW